MKKEFYYACLQSRDGKVERKRFRTRDEARNYIHKNFNIIDYKAAWTE